MAADDVTRAGVGTPAKYASGRKVSLTLRRLPRLLPLLHNFRDHTRRDAGEGAINAPVGDAFLASRCNRAPRVARRSTDHVWLC